MRAVAPGRFELQRHVARGVGLYALDGQCWVGVPAWPLAIANAPRRSAAVAQVAAALPSEQKALLGILHGDLSVPPTTTKNNLIGAVGRTSSIAGDQLALDAAYYVDNEAKRRNFATRRTSAANTGCQTPASDDMFSPVLGLWRRAVVQDARPNNDGDERSPTDWPGGLQHFV